QPDVFPHHMLRIRQLVGIPEAAPEELVPHRHVIEQPRRLGDVRPDLATLDGQRMQRRRVDPLRPDAQDGAAGEVGSRALQRVHEQLIRVGGQHVIAVDEGEALTAGALDAPGTRAPPSAKAKNPPRARPPPPLPGPPGPPCSGLISVNLGSAAAFARAISALPSVDPSSTMITSVSVNVWAAID